MSRDTAHLQRSLDEPERHELSPISEERLDEHHNSPQEPVVSRDSVRKPTCRRSMSARSGVSASGSLTGTGLSARPLLG
jgi:hypothetical protein